MKTFLTRTVPLLLGILLGTALSWVSIYSFWFAIWTFHSVPAARFIAEIGTVILFPARWITEYMGGDQSSVLYDPISYAGTNGLVLGILAYSVFRAIYNRRVARKQIEQTRPPSERIEAKVS